MESNQWLVQEAQEAYDQSKQISDQQWLDCFDATYKWWEMLDKYDKDKKEKTREYSVGKYDLIIVGEEPLEIEYDFWKICTIKHQEQFLQLLYKKSLNWWVLISTLEKYIKEEWLSRDWKDYLLSLSEDFILVRFLKTSHAEIVPLVDEITEFIPSLMDVYDRDKLLQFLEKCWQVCSDFFPRKLLSVYTFLKELPGSDDTWKAFFAKELNNLVIQQTYRDQVTELPGDSNEEVISLLKWWCVEQQIGGLAKYLWKYDVFEHDFSEKVMSWDKRLLPAATRQYLLQLFLLLPRWDKERSIILWWREKLMTPESLSGWKEMVEERWGYDKMLEEWAFDASTMAKLSVIRMMQNFQAESKQIPQWDRETIKQMFLQWFEKRMKKIYTVTDMISLIHSFHYVWDRSDIPEVQGLIDMMSDLLALEQEIDAYTWTDINGIKIPNMMLNTSDKEELLKLNTIWREEVMPFFKWVGESLRTRRNTSFNDAIVVNWNNKFAGKQWSVYFKGIWDEKIMRNIGIVNKILLKWRNLSKDETYSYLDTFFELVNLGDSWNSEVIKYLIKLLKDDKEEIPNLFEKFFMTYIEEKFWRKINHISYNTDNLSIAKRLVDYALLEAIKNDNEVVYENITSKFAQFILLPEWVLFEVNRYNSWKIGGNILKETPKKLEKFLLHDNFTLEKLSVIEDVYTVVRVQKPSWIYDKITVNEEYCDSADNRIGTDISDSRLLNSILDDLVWSLSTKQEKKARLNRLKSIKKEKPKIKKITDVFNVTKAQFTKEFFDLETTNKQWGTPLMKACESGDIDMFDLLLNGNEKVKIVNSVTWDSLLHYIWRCKNEKARKYMLEKLLSVFYELTWMRWTAADDNRQMTTLLRKENKQWISWIFALAQVHEFDRLDGVIRKRYMIDNKPWLAAWSEATMAQAVLTGDVAVWQFFMKYYMKLPLTWMPEVTREAKNELKRKLTGATEYFSYDMWEKKLYKGNEKIKDKKSEINLCIHPTQEYIDLAMTGCSHEWIGESSYAEMIQADGRMSSQRSEIYHSKKEKNKPLQRSPKLFSYKSEYSLPKEVHEGSWIYLSWLNNAWYKSEWNLLELAFLWWNFDMFKELLSYGDIELGALDKNDYIPFIVMLNKFLLFMSEDACKNEDDKVLYKVRLEILKEFLQRLGSNIIERSFHGVFTNARDRNTMLCLYEAFDNDAIFLDKMNKDKYRSYQNNEVLLVKKSIDILFSIWDLVEDKEKYSRMCKALKVVCNDDLFS